MTWYAWFIIGALSASVPWMFLVVGLMDAIDRERNRRTCRKAGEVGQKPAPVDGWGRRSW